MVKISVTCIQKLDIVFTKERQQNSIPEVGHDELAEINFVSMFCISNVTFFPTL